jgi:hypothetical protein
MSMVEPRTRLRSTIAGALTVLAAVLVWFGLNAPDRLGDVTPMAFVRVPIEALVFIALVLVLPPQARRAVAVLLGVVLGVLTMFKVLDWGFFEALHRPFDSVMDWRYLSSLVSLVQDSFGRATGTVVLVVAGVVLVALLVLMPLSLLRLTRILSRHPRPSSRVAAAGAAVWVLCAVLGVQVATGMPVASISTSTYTFSQVSRIPTQIRDQREFARATAHDPLRSTPGDELLTGLRGKDVLFVFVESYGRSAVEGSSFSPGIDAVLDDGTRRLRAAGFSSRSAFLTSPTFGAISWLAHSTLQSGLWVNSQQRYNTVVTSPRATLSVAFKRAGWRTVSDVPANTHDWPEGRFYHYDTYYDSRNVGYAGPRFGYPTMPDQFTFEAFKRLELDHSPRKPVMAEIDLITSHAPWSRTPHMIDPRRVGDGSVFEGMPEQAPSKNVIWRSPSRVRAAYGQSIEYSLSALVSFVERSADPDLAVVALGDHQPATVVSGENADHDVPITVIAHDPDVLDRVSAWGWQAGMRPHPDAPVWRMDAFRDRFLATFGPGPQAGRARAGASH